jgi:hypothetical protein
VVALGGICTASSDAGAGTAFDILLSVPQNAEEPVEKVMVRS